jgi:hypothetical protein
MLTGGHLNKGQKAMALAKALASVFNAVTRFRLIPVNAGQGRLQSSSWGGRTRGPSAMAFLAHARPDDHRWITQRLT